MTNYQLKLYLNNEEITSQCFGNWINVFLIIYGQYNTQNKVRTGNKILKKSTTLKLLDLLHRCGYVEREAITKVINSPQDVFRVNLYKIE